MVIAAFALRVKMMDIDKGREATAGDDAAMLVAVEHEAACGGWDLLRCARDPGSVHVDVLRVALRGLERSGVDRELAT
jgi:hypothetical protein